MRSPLVTTFAAIPLGLAIMAFAASSPPAVNAGSGILPLVRAAEVARIRAHFDSVLTELPQRDLAGLSAAQRERRSALVTTLRAYREAGVFPHNYDFPGEAVPYFVDRGTGTLCAVAHLLATTGRSDIVHRVARIDNNVWVAQLAGDTAFTGWLHQHGLTLAEAARIQVPYIVEDEPAILDSRSHPMHTGTVVALGGAAIASLWTAGANANGENRAGNILGALAGATAIGMGSATMVGDRDGTRIGAATILVGATSAWLSTRGIMRHQRTVAARREAERATVAPLLPLDGKSGAGLSVTLRF